MEVAMNALYLRLSVLALTFVAAGCSDGNGDVQTNAGEPTGADGAVGGHGGTNDAGKGGAYGNGRGTNGSAGSEAAIGGSSGTAATGDSSASDGSGGSVPFEQDAGPHTVLPCSGLGAAGKWENVTPPGAIAIIGPDHMGTSAFVVDPLDSGTVYLGTDSNHGVFKTTDCGASWVHINTGRHGMDLDNGRQWTFAIDPIDHQVMYTNSGYGTMGMYKSTNGGVDWDRIWPPPIDPQNLKSNLQYNFVGYFQLDPTDRHHVFVTFHEACFNQYAPGCIAESLDSGATWRLFGGPPFQAGARIYPIDSSTWIVGTYAGPMLRTTDRGASWKPVANIIAGGHSAADRMVRGSNGMYYLGSESGLAVSPDGIQWSLLPVGGYIKSTPVNSVAIFTSGQNGFNRVNQDDSKWTPMPNSPTNSDGCFAGYDQDHHLLYASCGYYGFWRAVAE
jgi:hypothetical protein